MYVYDPQGNVVQITDGTGAITVCLQTDSFGLSRASDGSTSTVPGSGSLRAYGFGGQWGYAGDGLILCTHRYYDPSNGRWLTRDPIGYDGGINLYGYVQNNPINDDDPFGYISFDRQKFVDCMKKQLRHSGPSDLEECWGKETIANWVIECGIQTGLSPHHTVEDFVKCMTGKFTDCLQQKGLQKALGKIAACVRYATGGTNPFPPPLPPIRPIPRNPNRHPNPGGGSGIRPKLTCDQPEMLWE